MSIWCFVIVLPWNHIYYNSKGFYMHRFCGFWLAGRSPEVRIHKYFSPSWFEGTQPRAEGREPAGMWLHQRAPPQQWKRFCFGSYISVDTRVHLDRKKRSPKTKIVKHCVYSSNTWQSSGSEIRWGPVTSHSQWGGHTGWQYLSWLPLLCGAYTETHISSYGLHSALFHTKHHASLLSPSYVFVLIFWQLHMSSFPVLFLLQFN